MIANPRPGQRVILCYRESLRSVAPHYGHCGTVVVVGRGKPRNHGVRLDDGRVIVVPCGHLNPKETAR